MVDVNERHFSKPLKAGMSRCIIISHIVLEQQPLLLQQKQNFTAEEMVILWRGVYQLLLINSPILLRTTILQLPALMYIGVAITGVILWRMQLHVLEEEKDRAGQAEKCDACMFAAKSQPLHPVSHLFLPQNAFELATSCYILNLMHAWPKALDCKVQIEPLRLQSLPHFPGSK